MSATSTGTIYIGNNDNYVVDKFTVGGNLTLFAGNHSATLETLYSGAPATGVVLNYPYGIADDSSGKIIRESAGGQATISGSKATGR